MWIWWRKRDPLTKEYPNLLVTQTYSKSRNFAGGRLGMAFGNKKLIEDLEKIRFSKIRIT
jgi:histidinol-phosphate aminotransferase